MPSQSRKQGCRPRTGTFRVRQQHGSDRRNAGAAGDEQQFAPRVISQIEMSRRSFELCLLSFFEMEQKTGTWSARNQIKQQRDKVRLAGLRGDGVSPRHETSGPRMRHFERNELAGLERDRFWLVQA